MEIEKFNKICKKHDYHRHSLINEINSMINNNIPSKTYYTNVPENSSIIGSLNIELMNVWRLIGRQCPFESVRTEFQNNNKIHIKNVKFSYPTYSAYCLTIEPFDETKIVQPQHNENPDELCAKYIREHDAMKKNLEMFVRFLIANMEENSGNSIEWQISSDYDQNVRVVGALDKNNQYKWDYIGRKSPFLIIRNKLANEGKYHLKANLIDKKHVSDRNVLTFNVGLSEIKN